MKKENAYQSVIIDKLHAIFPGCYVLKNDPHYMQGIPDLSIYFHDRWAMLECKRSEHEHHQPNQDFYVNDLNGMGFASFIYPENEEEVLSQLVSYFSHYYSLN